jgi:hypothetical protein
METLLKSLRKDFPAIGFESAEEFYWSPKDKNVYYKDAKHSSDLWSLLHETSHGVLNHQTFGTDFELLQLELAAWEKAKELAVAYSITIDTDHIEDCLDTYRDWLHKRSLCPECSLKSLQEDHDTYRCLNCATSWHVSANRLCRPYRAKLKPTSTELA